MVVERAMERPEDVGVSAGDAHTTVLPRSADDSVSDRIHCRPWTVPETLVLKPALAHKGQPLGGTTVRARAL
jgi:hypothetical protein